MTEVEIVQKQLNELYNDYFLKDIEINHDKEFLSKLSNPYLISVPKQYFDGKKIWYVGQETYTWYGKYLDIFLKKNNPVEYAIGLHKDFRLESKKTTPIWKYYANLFGAYNNQVVSNNIFKFDYIEGFGQWYTSSNMIAYQTHKKKLQDILDFQKDLFKKELEILKPDLVLLMTSHRQDDFAFNQYTDRAIISESITTDISNKELGKIISDFLPEETYRTYHPGYLNRLGKDKKNFIFDFLNSKVSN